MAGRSGTEAHSVPRYDRSAAGAVSIDSRAEKAGALGSIEEKKARLAQLSQEYERIMQEKMPVRLLKAFPNARSERYNEALEKSVRKSAPNEKGRLEISKERNPAQKAGNPPAGIKWPQPLRKPGGKGGAYAVLFLFTRLRQNRRSLTRAQPKNFSENKKPWHLPWLFRIIHSQKMITPQGSALIFAVQQQ